MSSDDDTFANEPVKSPFGLSRDVRSGEKAELSML